MKVYTKEFKTFLPLDIDKAWDFFSSPRNLAKITPKHMGFIITSNFNDEKMYPGMLITYKVSPLFGIQMDWCTEITHVIDKKYFVDEQRFGPYSMWHHQHHFKAIEGGIEMIDIVNYAVPMGILGRLMNSVMISKEIDKIFTYREKKVTQLFSRSAI
jgi:ligand-binding SRPBCC domain-containing protein